MTLNAALSWYQTKIGTYDKQSWERNVEQCILKGFSSVPKKTAKVKTDFIDVDLVRGSAFPKAKPQHGMLVVTRNALVRTIFLPFFLSWWQQQTTRKFAFLLFVLHILQISILIVYFTHSSEKSFDEITMTEVISPTIMMIGLGIIHSQVVSTHNPTSSCYSVCESLRRKRTRRRRQSKMFSKGSGGRRLCTSTEKLYSNDSLKSCSKSGVEFVLNTNPSSSSEESNEFRKFSSLQQLNGNNISFNKKLRELSSPSSDLRLCKDNNVNCDETASLDRVKVVRINCCHPNNRDKIDNEDQTSDEARHDSAVQDVSSVELETDQPHSDTELENASGTGGRQGKKLMTESKGYNVRRRLTQNLQCSANKSVHCRDCHSSCDSEIDTFPNTPIKDRAPTLDMEWGMTTNTDCDQSYESDTSEETDGPAQFHDDPFFWDCSGVTPPSALNASGTSSDKVSCTIWEGCECKKADLCVLDISSAIVHKVAEMPESTDYFICGICFTILMTFLPAVFRTHETARVLLSDVTSDVLDMSMPSVDDVNKVKHIITLTFLGSTFLTSYVMVAVLIERFFLSLFFFFLLSVAERTFKQRFLYAKLFSHLTSSRRSRRSELPYFRLNKVRNIKTWLSVRSYLKKHGPQRSVDVIVSAAFVIALLLISFLCIQILKENDHFGERLYNWEVLALSFALGVYLLRFMTLGAKINKKYRNFSVLLTEQINLYVQMEQKPHKKDGLILANNVLKLASQLLKELESPFKISGLSANPYLYNITKLVILSAFSAVLTELLGFKLKLYKIKIK